MFKRIAIVNRGEPAMRLINAVRELNAEHGCDIETVALYTDAERAAMFVREADLAYGLGPGSARPYLNHALLEQALLATGADAAWVGWGFVAEDPAFAELCARIGVTFIGPSPEAMRKLGDKIGSKLIAEQVGVPVAPWSRGPLDTLEDAIRVGNAVGYPVMLKATAGGGGRGIRMINSDDEMREAYQRTRDEAERAFGSGVVFCERLVTGARHVEVQVIADGQGTAWALGVRDCSVQRRNQKIIEESASPVLSKDQAAELKAAAERLAVAVDYRGAGTVEFLYHPEERLFAFLEVNTRLQVEHPITEITTSADLVRLQLHVAEGGRLTGEQPLEQGHAVEARLNAEDPDRDFAPAPGRIARLDLPRGPGVRVDTGFSEGDTIPADFDSMIAKIIAYGPDRDTALARLRRAVGDTTVVIEGGSTNKSFVLELLDEPAVIDGSADTGWIDRVRAAGGLVTHRHSGIALVAAAVEAYDDAEAAERARLLTTARGGRPQVLHEVGRPVEVKLRDQAYHLVTARLGAHRYRVSVGAGDVEQTVDVDIERFNDHDAHLVVAGRRFRIVSATYGPVTLIEVDGVTHRISRDEGGVLRAAAPALVVATPVAVGTEVEADAPVIVLESMKMETVLHAPFKAVVRQLAVSAGTQVEGGAALIRLEPIGEATESVANETAAVELDLPQDTASSTPQEAVQQGYEDLRGLLLGYDADPADHGRTLANYLAAREQLAEPPLGTDVDLLELFANFADLSRNRPAGEERSTELQVHSPREHFHTYLQSLDVERSGLPGSFVDRLTIVLAHYGVTDLEPHQALLDAVFRIFLAQQRTEPDVRLVTALLRRWLVEPAPGAATADHVRAVLDHLVLATQLRFPAIGDLARSVRFRWFDQPLVDDARRGVLAGVSDELTALAADPEASDYDERIAALATIPEQLIKFLADRLEDGTPQHEPMLEVLIRRHYLEYGLHDLTREQRHDRPYAYADYEVEAGPTRVISTVGTVSELADPGSSLVADLMELVAARPDGHDAVVDLYLSGPGMPDQNAAASERLRSVVSGLPWLGQVRRVALAVAPGHGRDVFYFTFRPQLEAEGLSAVEDDNVRGVHPMVGRRLNLWRLQDFDITRIEAPQDVLLYDCVAKDNPSDERLVALAQVRQFAVIRDEHGTITSLPHVERAIAACLEGIRAARTTRGAAGAKLEMNHVWVTFWPVIQAEVAELAAVWRNIAPMTVGAGIEEVIVQGRVVGKTGTPFSVVGRFFHQPGSGVQSVIERPPTERLKPLDGYAQKVVRARNRNTVYPYELAGMIAGSGGSYVEHDLDADGALVPVDRPRGQNTAGLIVGLIKTPTKRYPEGLTRVVLSGDPTKALGALAEPECARIVAALDLAAELGVPVEWYAVSAGAKIAMDSGVENMDWIAKALRRIVEFTQAGGEINIVVAGINVGAQPYWNAEATMLMHTKGILIMTPDSAMVLTGKESLDFSGGVSAEDNFGIGGYDRVMGPNGQAQYWAPDLAGARDILLRHYEHSYAAPGESGPRRADTVDPTDRNVTTFPHDPADGGFTTVGDIFSKATNPERKKAFNIRTLMRAVTDADHPILERWQGMADADTAVVWDARLGGWPVCLIGIESKPTPRRGFPPTDGPDIWTAGTLFPRSSKKVARAINAASGSRPLVILANLSGFDGSPDSMRNLQLEYGAEIGRAIVNFAGPIVFCVVSRYHGGAFVVFSKTLNDNMTVLAVEGSYASVIGGAPAAAVVFAREVNRRTGADARVVELESRVASSDGAERASLSTELGEVRSSVRSEKLGQVADEFDAVHSIRRAVEVGAVDAVIAAADLRPELIAAVERGLSRA